MYGVILFIHLLSATIWTGGHLVLALTILPRALKSQTIEEIQQFEKNYELIGIPSLVIQILSGLWLAHHYIPDLNHWFLFSDPLARLVLLKLGLLGITMCFALDARLRVIPNLSVKNLNSLAWHIIPVTIISVLFVFVGVSFRTGWLY
ncbi:MAG: CopD family protein [Candidatus Cloacimonetes bacterium]|nr:CopD family protein [Candidatus Cloacimonadota bacterium]